MDFEINSIGITIKHIFQGMKIQDVKVILHFMGLSVVIEGIDFLEQEGNNQYLHFHKSHHQYLSETFLQL